MPIRKTVIEMSEDIDPIDEKKKVPTTAEVYEDDSFPTPTSTLRTDVKRELDLEAGDELVRRSDVLELIDQRIEKLVAILEAVQMEEKQRATNILNQILELDTNKDSKEEN